MRIASQIPNSDQSPLYDVRNPARASCEGCDVRSDVSRTIFERHGQPVFWSARLRSFELRRGSLRYDRLAEPKLAQPAKAGGARRDRTDDLMLAKHALSQLSYGPVPEDECLTLDERRLRSIKVVGLGRLELPTSRLSSARSNQLSYKPLTRGVSLARTGLTPMHRTSAAPGACSSAKKEKRRRRNPANGAQQS